MNGTHLTYTPFNLDSNSTLDSDDIIGTLIRWWIGPGIKCQILWHQMFCDKDFHWSDLYFEPVLRTRDDCSVDDFSLEWFKDDGSIFDGELCGTVGGEDAASLDLDLVVVQDTEDITEFPRTGTFYFL